MHIRSDSTLKYLLLKLHEHAKYEEIAQHITEVLDHIGERSPYRGGRVLIELLEFAEREAASKDDQQTSAGLTDAIGYALGTVLENDLDSKYQLSSSDGQEDSVQMMQRVINATRVTVAKEIEEYLSENPGASGEDIKDYFAQHGRRALRFVQMRQAGHYGAFRIRTDSAAWITEVIADRVDFVSGARDIDPRIEELLEFPDAEAILTGAVITLRRRQIERVRRTVENRYSAEEHIRKALSDSWWIFGGNYVCELARRRLTYGLELDIPLLRPDGVLHLVELKKANVAIVKRYRSGLIPTSEVHNAVGQVSNYLRQLDEDRNEIAESFGIETRRSFATVVVGHPDFHPEFDPSEINEAIRTYASHLSRIDIVTYQEILNNAERSLKLTDRQNKDDRTQDPS